MKSRLNPSLIVELTAAPRDHQNILFSVAAQALKDEEMTEIPIRVRPHLGWKDAVRGGNVTINILPGNKNSDSSRLRPITLYQAQDRTGHPTAEELRQHLTEARLTSGPVRPTLSAALARHAARMRSPAAPPSAASPSRSPSSPSVSTSSSSAPTGRSTLQPRSSPSPT